MTLYEIRIENYHDGGYTLNEDKWLQDTAFESLDADHTCFRAQTTDLANAYVQIETFYRKSINHAEGRDFDMPDVRNAWVDQIENILYLLVIDGDEYDPKTHPDNSN